MKYLKQFGIIIIITFIGEILHSVLPLPVPASIYGLLLMLIALMTHILKVEDVEDTAKFLLEIMPLMFISAAAGLIDTWSVLQDIWLQVLVITLVSTVLVMVVAGRVNQRVIRHQVKQNTMDESEQATGSVDMNQEELSDISKSKEENKL